MDIKESRMIENVWYLAVMKGDSKYKEATLEVAGVGYYKLE